MSCRRRSFACSCLLASLALVLGASPAAAATWGSFSASRIAYATGPLTGTAHDDLRAIIVGHGDTVAPATNQLTADYLATVDVFYTAMLSDGTGPTAGAFGTLSLPEQAALQDFIAGGGTLIITPDSNGFDGPFPLVYDSWLEDYGVTGFAFVFGPGLGMSAVVHPITEGVDTFALDGTVTFSYPAEAEVLAIDDDGAAPLMVVLEPASGFAVGGRLLVLADHNALTNAFLETPGNHTLAEKIVAWAAGECGNTIVEAGEVCDDGNTTDGDGCDAACGLEGEAGSSGGLDDTAGPEESGASEGTEGPPSTSSGVTDPSPTDPSPTDGDETGGPAIHDNDGGCSCRSSSSPRLGALLLLALGMRRRRRRR